eukprot:gene19635-39055_t
MSPRMDYRGVGTPSNRLNRYSERFEPQKDDVSSSHLEDVRVPLDFDFDAQQDDFTDVPSDNMLTDDPQVIDMRQDQTTADQRSTEPVVDVPPVPKRHSYDLRPRKPRRAAFNSHGFIVNPMDICLFNKTVDQITIVAHVDDLITSVSSALLDDTVNFIERTYKAVKIHRESVLPY